MSVTASNLHTASHPTVGLVFKKFFIAESTNESRCVLRIIDRYVIYDLYAIGPDAGGLSRKLLLTDEVRAEQGVVVLRCRMSIA